MSRVLVILAPKAQLTTFWLKRSITTARYSHPSWVAMQVMSPAQTRSGWPGWKSRLSRLSETGRPWSPCISFGIELERRCPGVPPHCRNLDGAGPRSALDNCRLPWPFRHPDGREALCPSSPGLSEGAAQAIGQRLPKLELAPQFHPTRGKDEKSPSAKSLERMVGVTGIEPVTPTMSTEGVPT
jgi:hypothetical protein